MRKKLLFIFMMCMAGISGSLKSQPTTNVKQIKAALRRIGNEVLLANQDSVSRVLPIEQEGSSFKINFESSFSFDPGLLASIVEKELDRSRINNRYILEVEDCDSGKVVYSYEVFYAEKEDLIPCNGRMQEYGCYSLLLQMDLAELSIDASQDRSDAKIWYLIVFAVLAGLLGFYLFKRKRSSAMARAVEGDEEFAIGLYRFQPERGELIFDSLKQELTGKESELLLALYNSRNKTMKREDLLQAVWGDEGDYVGRTLDVFVSRLRKKLEHDPSVKIQNIRGVGYRLVI